MGERTNTYGGKVDHRAVIGHAPESRDWKPGDKTFPVVIHKTARVEAFVSIDAGTIRATTLGARSWCLKHAHLGHDVIVGEDCEISTGAILGGHCEIGNRVRVGIGAVLRPFVKVGAGARIGCGAVVVKDVPAGEVWAGNPAKQLSLQCQCGEFEDVGPDYKRHCEVHRDRSPRVITGVPDVQGLQHRYEVIRVRDGRREAVRDRCFVMRPECDPFAWAAVLEYAFRCREKHPQLSDDLREWVLGIIGTSA